MKKNPRVLMVTPEITSVPPGMRTRVGVLTAKAGGMADVCSGLVTALYDLGADVHVAMPNYRRLFQVDISRLGDTALRDYKEKLPDDRIHLAEDSIFYYRTEVYGRGEIENPMLALRFQREVINHILPEVQPDLVHCNDWMTGLIPAAARRLGIPSLFTVHNIHSYELPLQDIEESGIDAAEFWTYLYYTRMPVSYQDARAGTGVDVLVSGIFASHFMNTVSPKFLDEVVRGSHDFVSDSVRTEIRNKWNAGCGVGILNAPSARYNPRDDRLLARRYGPQDLVEGKRANKLALQRELGLRRDESAPLLFWPSRLDPRQKGCELLTEILADVVVDHSRVGLQVAVVADGPYDTEFRDVVRRHGIRNQVAVTGFDERLSHLAFAGADFILMPSLYEPCGLPQMIGAIYGSLPVVHDTGGLHDTVTHLDAGHDVGNGFVFSTYDANGLRWAIDEAMRFYGLPGQVRERQIGRVMTEAIERFNHHVTARHYFDLYEQMLQRPLVAD